MPRKHDTEALESSLAAIAAKPRAELASLVLAIVENGKLVLETALGRSYIDPLDPSRDKAASTDTLYRVASISKPVTALAVLSLVEEGRLDLEADVSTYLGWPLRNPAWPAQKISAAMLLTHTSSLRDGDTYTMPLGGTLREFFEPGGRLWENGAHFASPNEKLPPPLEGSGFRPDLAPGRFFCYCNLGFGVLATVVEAISRERFDLYVKRRILEPLEMEASFNTGLLSDSAFRRLAPIYRKGAEGNYDPEGVWTAQVDDYRGVRPILPCVALPGMGPADLAAWQPGINGSFFSPQGGMRASVRDLGRLLRFFIGKGELDGRRLLARQTMETMMTPRWRFDPQKPNGDCYLGLLRECGLALCHGTGSLDTWGGDRLKADGGPLLWGHHADAYGLFGSLLFHPEESWGFAYLVGGSAEDPEKLRGRHSSFFLWEEEIQEAVLAWLLG